jgi:hypothetical protein
MVAEVVGIEVAIVVDFVVATVVILAVAEEIVEKVAVGEVGATNNPRSPKEPSNDKLRQLLRQRCWRKKGVTNGKHSGKL